MGTTASRGFPYPENSDLVTQGAAAIQALAEAVDAELDPVAFAAVLDTTGQSIGTGAWSTVTAWVESEDTAPALVGGVFTAPVRGIYTFTATMGWNGNPTGDRYTSLWLNDAKEIPGAWAPAASDPRQIASAIVELAAGDTIRCKVFQSSGANRTVAANATQTPTFGGHLVTRTLA